MTTGEGKIRILSYPDFEPVFHYKYQGQDPIEFSLHGHTSSSLSAELQPTGRYLATGGSDSIIALWDTTDWICQRTLTSMAGPVRSISELHDLLVNLLGVYILIRLQVSRLMAAMWLEEVTRVSRASPSNDSRAPNISRCRVGDLPHRDGGACSQFQDSWPLSNCGLGSHKVLPGIQRPWCPPHSWSRFGPQVTTSEREWCIRARLICAKPRWFISAAIYGGAATT